MTELEDVKSTLRSEVGRAIGFVIGSLVLSAQDGRLPTATDIQHVLDHYRRQFKAFTPEVDEIVQAMTDGLAFAAQEARDGTRL